MTATFTWRPKVDPSGSVTLRVRSIQFGDGYAMSVADGINTKVQSWPVSFTGSDTYISAIIAFLDAQGGYTSFNWTPPLGVQGLYRCAGYTVMAHGGAVDTLSCTFSQVYSP
jgi:phage-related protein